MSREIRNERIQLGHGTAHLKTWRIDHPFPSGHGYRYQLRYLEREHVRVLYEVQPGRPDHKCIDGVEFPYEFEDPQTLATDFFHDIDGLAR